MHPCLCLYLAYSYTRISIHLFLGFCGPIILTRLPVIGWIPGRASRVVFRSPEHVDPVEGPPEGQPSRLLTLWRPSHRVHHIKYRFCSFTIAFRTQNKWALPRGRHIVFVPVQLPSEPRTRGDDGDLGLLVNTA